MFPPRLLLFAIDVYILIVLARVIVSWVRIDPEHPAVLTVRKLTEPLLAPIRRVIDPWQRQWGIDFSPVVLIIALGLLQGLLAAL